MDMNKPVTHGYARCSTNEEKQDIDRQVRELKPPAHRRSGWNTSTETPSTRSSKR